MTTHVIDNRAASDIAENESYLEQRIEVLQAALRQMTKERDEAWQAIADMNEWFRKQPVVLPRATVTDLATCIAEQKH